MLTPGDPVPSLYLRAASNPHYAFDSVAGRYVALTFIGGRTVPGMGDFLAQLYASVTPFDDLKASCFVVSNDARDETSATLVDRYPGIRVVWDHKLDLARLFGCVGQPGAGGERLSLMTFILDPALRVLAVIPMEDPRRHFQQIADYLASVASPTDLGSDWAPVLKVPNLLEPELCKRLIAYCEAQGPEDSGYMKTDRATGQTVMVVDHDHKRRSDCIIEDDSLRDALQARIHRRLVPQIERAFQFRVSRMERYLVARYDTATGGHFRAHKDNTTLGTAHRRFAVSINLNAEDYDGGDLRFPEFGMRTYRPPTGGAVVFSCSLLHEATPMTRGTRYCVLPFLYDEAAAAIRLQNAQHLQDPVLRDQVVASVLAKQGLHPIQQISA